MKKTGPKITLSNTGCPDDMPSTDKYEIFVGQELSVQAIWKTVHPACPGESDLAMFLTNRAYSRGISIAQLRGKGRNALVKLIMLDEEGGAA